MVSAENQGTSVMYEFMKHNLVLFYNQIVLLYCKKIDFRSKHRFRILRIKGLSSKNQNPRSRGCKDILENVHNY